MSIKNDVTILIRIHSSTFFSQKIKTYNNLSSLSDLHNFRSKKTRSTYQDLTQNYSRTYSLNQL